MSGYHVLGSHMFKADDKTHKCDRIKRTLLFVFVSINYSMFFFTVDHSVCRLISFVLPLFFTSSGLFTQTKSLKMFLYFYQFTVYRLIPFSKKQERFSFLENIKFIYLLLLQRKLYKLIYNELVNILFFKLVNILDR